MSKGSKDQKTSQNQRKQKSRDEAAAQGIKRVDVSLSESEIKMLDEGCEARGGVRGAYSRNEYIATLIRRDNERLKAELEGLETCQHCKKPLPEGCGGAWKGVSTCFHTFEALGLQL